MIIPINIPSAGSGSQDKLPPQLAKIGTDEVVLIELQGTFEVEGDARGQIAASLRFGENEAKPTMLVGHNLLEGKIVNLAKPLAVLKKKETRISAGTSAAASTSASFSPTATTTTSVKIRPRRRESANDDDESMDVDEGEDRNGDEDEDDEWESAPPRTSLKESGSRVKAAAEAEETRVEYDLVALVKRKLLFSKRPMPVVNMVQTSRTLPGKP